MGQCKEEMKKTVSKTKKGFGFLNRKSKEESAGTFVDMILEAEAKLAHLIDIKEKELQEEKGEEDHNRKAMSLLRTMSFYLDQVCDAAEKYSEL